MVNLPAAGQAGTSHVENQDENLNSNEQGVDEFESDDDLLGLADECDTNGNDFQFDTSKWDNVQPEQIASVPVIQASDDTAFLQQAIREGEKAKEEGENLLRDVGGTSSGDDAFMKESERVRTAHDALAGDAENPRKKINTTTGDY